MSDEAGNIFSNRPKAKDSEAKHITGIAGLPVAKKGPNKTFYGIAGVPFGPRKTETKKTRKEPETFAGRVGETEQQAFRRSRRQQVTRRAAARGSRLLLINAAS